jgi:LPS sulfotransferase NodH
MAPVEADRRAIKKSLRTNFNPGPRDRLNRVMLRARQASHLPALLTGKDLERPIFIVGAPRSGTSLLYSILRSSPEVAHWPGEAHEVWEADYHPALRDWSSNALDASDVDERAADRIRREFLLVTGQRRRLIDKTPRNALRIDFVEALFPDAYYVFLQRDGRDNVNSLINAWRTPRYRTYELPRPHSIPGVDPKWWKFVLYPGWRADTAGPLELVCARQWHLSNDLALASSKRIDPERWIPIRYEDLVAEPVTEIGRVADRLRLRYGETMRDKAAALSSTPVNVVTPPERGKWRKENPAEITGILDLVKPTMEALGYGIDED